MKVGLYLSNQHHLDKDLVSAFAEQQVLVRAARDGGWDSLFSGQHYLNEGDNQQLEIVPYLARLMADAGEMTVGMGIFLLTLHNPVYVAETIASLDVLSGGKFVFGVGLAYRTVEFDAFGIARGTRVRRFEEALDVVRRLWSGEAVSYAAPHCRLDNVRMNLRPVQRPHPPLWFGGSSDGALRRAARLGDTWFCAPLADLPTVRTQLGRYREALVAAGKPHPAELPLFRELCCAPDRATAFARAERALLGKYADYARWGQEESEAELDLAALARERFIIGTPEDCYEQLRPYWEELGFNHLVLRPHWAGLPLSDALATMRLASRELLPALRRVRVKGTD